MRASRTVRDDGDRVRARTALCFVLVSCTVGCGAAGGGHARLHPSVAAFRRTVIESQSRHITGLGWLGADREVQIIWEFDEEELNRRVAAVKAGGEAAILSLCGLLLDEEFMVSLQSAEALGKLGSTLAVPILLKHLGDASHWRQRAMVEALGMIGDRRAVVPLSEFLLTSRNGNASFAAFEILLRWQDPRARKSIEAYLPWYPTILLDSDIKQLEALGIDSRNAGSRAYAVEPPDGGGGGEAEPARK